MHHSKELAFTFIMMLVFSLCTVSFNNHSTGSPFVKQCNQYFCAILVEGIMRDNSVKLFGIWVSGSGDVI